MHDPGDDWQERWLARFEVRIDKRIDDFQRSAGERLESLEKTLREHVEKPGHASESDIKARVGRLENWIMGLLVGVLTTASGLLVELLSRAFGGKP